MPDIAILLDFAHEKWPINHVAYPGYELLTPEQQKRFALDHILKHQVKAVGGVAASLEMCDHGGQLDEGMLKILAAKMLLNAARFAHVVGLTATEFERLMSDS